MEERNGLYKGDTHKIAQISTVQDGCDVEGPLRASIAMGTLEFVHSTYDGPRRLRRREVFG